MPEPSPRRFEPAWLALALFAAVTLVSAALLLRSLPSHPPVAAAAAPAGPAAAPPPPVAIDATDGRALYLAHCGSCHGNGMEGAAGPCLSDGVWLHGGSRTEVVRSITLGYPEKGMPLHQGILSEQAIATLADHILGKRSGLGPVHAKVWQGNFKALPDFATLGDPTLESDAADGVVSLESFHIESNYAVQFTGDFTVLDDGEYQFRVCSDDGSRVLLDGQPLIENDGLHGPNNPPIRATVNLKAGVHKMEIQFFQAGGGQTLALGWSGPGFRLLPLTKDTTNLVPPTLLEVETAPRVDRLLLAGLPPHTVAVGMPKGAHFAFDPSGLALVAAWTGDYIDATPDRTGRGGQDCKRLGKDVLPGPVAFQAEGLRWLGYENKAGKVTLLLQLGPATAPATAPATLGLSQVAAESGASKLTFDLVGDKPLPADLLIRVPAGLKAESAQGRATPDGLVIPRGTSSARLLLHR